MIKNYFKLFYRNLIKQKLYSSINVGGLSIGLTCFILIFLFVKHELSYDQFYSNSNDIYRIYQKNEGNSYLGSDLFGFTPMAMAQTLKADYPEVSFATTIKDQKALLSYNQNNFYEQGLWGDMNFFNVFHHPFVKGNPQTALQDAKSIVLGESLANKIFGTEDPLNKSITFRNGDAFTVTGVMKDLTNNTSIKYAYVSSILSNGQYDWDTKNDQWGNNDYFTFFSLLPTANSKEVQSKFSSLTAKYIKRREDYKFKDSFLLQPLSAYHFENKINFDIGTKGNPLFISMFSIIAGLVLLLATINYMNLAITRSVLRVREVGVRKVIGANRQQLVLQFLCESVLITFLSLILAIGVTYFLAPVFGQLLDRPLALNLLENVSLIPGLLLLVVFVGVLSGSYPALIISKLKPIQIFNKKVNKFSGMTLQSGLTIGQFAISTTLIICSIVIFCQFQFIQNQELGFDKEQVLTISVLDQNMMNNMQEIKTEWLTNPNIHSVTTTWELPTNLTSGTSIHLPHQSREEAVNIYRARVGHDYLKVFDIKLIAGRSFSESLSSDSSKARIINETAASMLGWKPHEAVGKKIVTGVTEKSIIGVVKDFHMHSMHMEIGPMLLEMQQSPRSAYIAMKLNSDNLTETISFVTNSLKSHSPYPVDYQFLDEQFDELYKADLKAGELFGFFTILSIILAALGLFGLAAFSTQQRGKEISIRKILGGSMINILSMLTKDFIKMVFIGFVIAAPLAWYIMNGWLQKYAYRIELEWWMFITSGMIALFIALFSTSSQAIKAAVENPIKNLRSE